MAYHDEVEIEEFEAEEDGWEDWASVEPSMETAGAELKVQIRKWKYTYPCPCGDQFFIGSSDLLDGK